MCGARNQTSPSAPHHSITYSYDAAGHLTRDEQYRQHSYDAAGRKVEVSDYRGSITQAYDGDGRRGRRIQVNADPAATITTYYLTSSALGGAVLTETDAQGSKVKTNVYANGEVIATQNVGLNIWGLMCKSQNLI